MFTTWQRRLRRGGRQRSLAHIGIEGAVVAGMFAFTELWLVHLLVRRLGGTDTEVAMLNILPMAAIAVLGVFAGPLITLLGGNRRALLWCCVLQCVGLAGLYPAIHAPQADWAVPLAVGCGCLIGAVGAFGGPAWTSLLADLVPDRLRGRFLGGRFRIFMGCKLALSAGYAGILALLPAETTSLGLDLILGLAVLSRGISTMICAKLGDTPRSSAVRPSSRLLGFARDLRGDLRLLATGAMGRWNLCYGLVLFGVHLAGPFFSTYLLRPEAEGGLAQGPIGYWGLLQTSHYTRLLVLPAVGILIDRLGPLTTLRVALVGICIVPVIWGLSAQSWLIVVTEIGSGLFWCMAECSIAVLLLGCHDDPAVRARLVAWTIVVGSVATIVGNLLGERILAILPGWTGSPYRDLFLLSALARMPGALLALFLLPAIGIWHRAGRQRLRRALAEVPPPLGMARGLLRFLRGPEG